MIQSRVVGHKVEVVTEGLWVKLNVSKLNRIVDSWRAFGLARCSFDLQGKVSSKTCALIPNV